MHNGISERYNRVEIVTSGGVRLVGEMKPRVLGDDVGMHGYLKSKTGTEKKNTPVGRLATRDFL